MEENTINERIAKMVNELSNGNKSAFSKAVGISNQSLAEILGKRQSAPSFAGLQKMFVAFPQVRMDWLLLGEGEMLKGDSKPTLTVDNLPARPVTIQYHPEYRRDRMLQGSTPLSEYKQSDIITDEWVTFLAWLNTLGMPTISCEQQADYIKRIAERKAQEVSSSKKPKPNVKEKHADEYAYFEVAADRVTSELSAGQWVIGRKLTNRIEYEQDKLYTVVMNAAIFTRYLSVNEATGYFTAYTYNHGNPPISFMAEDILEIWAVVKSR